MTQNEQFDLIVIGAGSAGGACAAKANEAGWRVALIERDEIGGTCLNYGCDPTKTALHAVKVLHHAQHGARYGLDIPQAAADWRGLRQRIQTVQAQMRGGSREEARAKKREQGIDLIMGEGSFVSAHGVAVNGRRLQADHIVIAAGAEPAVPKIPGLAQTGFLTNKTVFELPQPPGSVAVMGAGSVGVEFAQFFARLGVPVDLIEMAAHILPQDDPDLAADLAAVLEEEGVTIRTQAKVTAVTPTDSGKALTLQYENGYEEQIVVDALLVAAGRRPAAAALNLDAAGVEVADGQITANAALQTSVPHIWAAGDITTRYPFTHVAWRQGEHVATNILRGETAPFAHEPIPWVTYTDPELVHVGQREADLQQAGTPYRVVSRAMVEVARAIITGQTQGRVKLLIGEDDQILGAHLLAAHGGELAAPLLLAMQTGVPAAALAKTVWPYPTLSDVWSGLASELLPEQGERV